MTECDVIQLFPLLQLPLQDLGPPRRCPKISSGPTVALAAVPTATATWVPARTPLMHHGVEKEVLGAR
jgi:hypothetical protein